MSAFTYPFYKRTTGEIEVAWGDVQSKPSTFSPASHDNEVHTATYISEAPIDGKQYARVSGEWGEVSGMENHGNEYHTSAFMLASDVGKMIFDLVKPHSDFISLNGAIVSLTTGATFEVGIIESFTTLV